MSRWSTRLHVTAFAVAGLLLTAQSPPPGEAATAWCTGIPLPHAGASCRSLDVTTPKRVLRLAVAATEAQREHGLMGVPNVPSGEGMLFAFPDAGDAPRYFWMKDTITALDMVFVKNDGSITEIAGNVPATTFGQSDDKVARRDGVGRYVIELRAGEAARLGLQVGMRLTIPSIPAQ